MSRCLTCRRKVGGGADDDDFDPMKSPAANSAFTPDSERIRPSTPLRSAFPRHRPRLLAPRSRRNTHLPDLHRDVQAVRRSGFVCEFFVISGGWGRRVSPSRARRHSSLHLLTYIAPSTSATPLPLPFHSPFLPYTTVLSFPSLASTIATNTPANSCANQRCSSDTLSAIADVRNALVHLSLVFRHTAREGHAVFGRSGAGGGGVEGAGWVWREKAKGRRRRKAGKRGSKTKRSTHTNRQQPPFTLQTSHSPSRAACSPLSSDTWGAQDESAAGPRWEMSSTDTGGKGQLALRAAVRGQYWRIIDDSCLLPDLQLLADGDLTERRKGINLSGESLPDIRFRILIADSTRRWTDAAREHRPRCTTAWTSSFSMTHFPLYLTMDWMAMRSRRQCRQGALPQRDPGARRTGQDCSSRYARASLLAQCDYIYTLDGGRIAEAGRTRAHRARGRVSAARSRVWGAEAEDAGRDGGAGENGDEDEAQVQVVSVEDTFLEKISTYGSIDNACSAQISRRIPRSWLNGRNGAEGEDVGGHPKGSHAFENSGASAGFH
ncbi:hypothetical protein B0H13DRAFT_1915977 [Mycena leptocephala]|nr:hypothetical protein B0H13DRAFT_1915977 [Mycena leptocephala]